MSVAAAFEKLTSYHRKTLPYQLLALEQEMLENRSNTTAPEAVDLSASRDGLGPIYKRYVLAISRLNSHLKLLKYDPSSDAQHFVDVHFANRSFVVSKVLQSFGTICHSLTQLAQELNSKLGEENRTPFVLPAVRVLNERITSSASSVAATANKLSAVLSASFQTHVRKAHSVRGLPSERYEPSSHQDVLHDRALKYSGLLLALHQPAPHVSYQTAVENFSRVQQMQGEFRTLKESLEAEKQLVLEAKAQHAALAADLRESRARADALEKERREVSARLREKENERHHLLQKVRDAEGRYAAEKARVAQMCASSPAGGAVGSEAQEPSGDAAASADDDPFAAFAASASVGVGVGDGDGAPGAGGDGGDRAAIGGDGGASALGEGGDFGEPPGEMAGERTASGYTLAGRSERTASGRSSASTHNIELSGYSLDESQRLIDAQVEKCRELEDECSMLRTSLADAQQEALTLRAEVEWLETQMAAERQRAACTSAVADAAPSTRPADSSDSSPRRADETEPSERSSRPFTVQVFDDEESNALDRSQEGKEIEAVLKTYFGAKINQLQQQVQAADHRALELASENERAAALLGSYTEQISDHQGSLAKAQEELEKKQDELETVRTNLESNVRMLTEHCQSLRNSKVKCEKCQKWNTVGWLVSKGDNGNRCKHDNHPTGSYIFQAEPSV